MEFCVLNTKDLTEAELAKSKLEAEGIFCELRANDAGGVLPYLRLVEGVQLYVAEEDAERSLEILNEKPTA